MTRTSSIRRLVGLIGTMFAGGLLLASGQALGLTEAGQVISNEATVAYEDSLGNTFSATSNEAIVTVAPVYSATIEQDRTRTGAPGQTVYFQHFVNNTGNVVDTYTISAFRDDGRDGVSDTPADDSDYFVYVDSNGNGVPDSGEPIVVDPSNENGTITVNAGASANLVVAFPIPGGAANAATFGVTIQATSTNTTVSDLTASGGVDGLPETNNDLVNVTTGAALTLVKNATFDDNDTPDDPNDDGVVYTLQVTNNGGSAATNVDILDVIPTNTTFDTGRAITVAGLSAANGDSQMTGASAGVPTLQSIGTGVAGAFAINETNVGLDGAGSPESIDMNVDGDTADTGLTAIYFRDARLGPNVTVSVTYRVNIDSGLNAGTPISNVFVADDTDSPIVTVNVLRIFDVTARDTGDDTGGDDVNDGQDDDELNDEQFVNRVADGAVVLFNNIIENTGNGPDVFELSIANDAGAGGGAGASCSPFPNGTVFTFYNSGNTASLSNTNGAFGVDTGSLARNASLAITVRADLPAGISGIGDFCATLTVRSFGAGTVDPVSDTKIERLGEIIPPLFDLANADYDIGSTTLPQEVTGTITSPAAAGATAETDAFLDNGIADTHPASGIASWAEIAAGAVQNFELFIGNEGVVADSYDLSANNLPPGWSVQFLQRGVDTDGDGVLNNTAGAGSIVTTTPLIPPGAVFQYTARVTASALAEESRANPTAVQAPEVDDANGDGDGDYVVTFVATSSTDGSTDSKRDAIDIADDPAVAVTPNSADQVQPGGSVSYANTVVNTGNTNLDLTLTLAHSEAGFDNSTLVDTNGDGTPDTAIGSLVAGTISVDPDGAGPLPPYDVEVMFPGSDPVFTLEPGESIPLAVTVQAPANAAAGTTDTLTITAADAGLGVSDSAVDTTEVVTVQVRLEKTVAVDTTCVCNPTSLTFPPAASSGVTSANADVEPGQCVVWLLTATNQSTQDAFEVTMADAQTPFTILVDPDTNPGSGDEGQLYYRGPAELALTLKTAATGDDEAELSGTDVLFTVGTLAGGESASGSFCVRVD